MTWQFLSDDERRQVARELADLELVWGGYSGRAGVLRLAGLAHLVGGLHTLANSSAQVFAAELVVTLENEMTLPDDPARQALGALLDYLAHLGDTPASTQETFARLINRYGLLVPSRAEASWRAARRWVEDGTRGEKPSPQPLPPLDADGRVTLLEPGALPPKSRIPYDRNSLYTGREDELRALAQRVLYAAAAAPAVISTGIGGIGKTQLAVEFAYRYGRYLAGGVHWVSLADEAPEAVGREVIACGERMGLWPLDDTVLPNAEKIKRTRDEWLKATPRLLIFDNCENPVVLEAWRPVGGGARVLVTSRNDDWPAGFAMLAVPTLPRDRSIALLRAYLAGKRDESDAALGEVASELGDLPLALTLAGSYLASYPSIPVSRYLDDLHRVGPLEHLRPREGVTAHDWTKHDQDVARTFQLSLDRLEPNSWTNALAMMLLVGSTVLVHGEPFPRALAIGIVSVMITSIETTDNTQLPNSAELRDAAVRRLLALGFLERVGAGQLRLHRLLAIFAATALVKGKAKDPARPMVERAAIYLSHEQFEARDLQRLRQWEIHLRHVTDAAFEREDEHAAMLCANLGYYLNMSGDPAGAWPYFMRALAIYEQGVTSEQPYRALDFNTLSYLLKGVGDLVEARPYVEHTLTIDKNVLETIHLKTGKNYNNPRYQLGTLDDSELLQIKKAVTAWESILGPEHSELASVMNSMALMLQSTGHFAVAFPYVERALSISERVLGKEHLDTAAILNNLGRLLHELGDWAAARSYLERALTIHERVLGLEDPATAMSLNNLGGLLRAMGDLATAKIYCNRALAIRERTLGPEHPQTAQSLSNLAGLKQNIGDLVAARLYFERAIFIYEKKLGLDHPYTRIVRDNLARLAG